MEVLAYLGYLTCGVILLVLWPSPDDGWSEVATVTAAGTVATASSVLWVGSVLAKK